MQNPVTKQKFSLAPTTLEEAMKLAELISKSSLCPKDFRDKPGDILIATQMGAEVGLAPMQAIQNIAVINGRPCIWGDAVLAIMMKHPDFEDINEWTEGDINKDATAYCTIKRKNREPVTRKFSIEDAQKANLLNKEGPWKAYRARMLQMRARGFAARDSFTDALKGLNIAEEIIDLDPKDYTVKTGESKQALNSLQQLNASTENVAIVNIQTGEIIEQAPIEPKLMALEQIIQKIENAQNLQDLESVKDLTKHLTDQEKEQARNAYASKKKELKS